MADDADAPEPATCTFTPDELDVSESIIDDLEACSRPVWKGADARQCVWHTEGTDKPPAELAATVKDGALSGARVRASDLTRVSFPEASTLVGADLRGANLRTADLRGADLQDADLTGANLQDADLRWAVLFRTDLGGSDLRAADLSGASLRDADLGGADLRAADLRNTTLAGTTLDEVLLARSTRLDAPVGKAYLESSDPRVQDMIARANHELRTAYSENGLTGRARRARIRERTARRKEAFVEEGWRGTAAGLGSLVSRWVAGYGVQLWPVALVMLLLYGVSVGVYWWAGMAFDRALYYSTVTFTTSPPESPPLGLASIMAGIETFAGTALIVLLGYVLGAREQV